MSIIELIDTHLQKLTVNEKYFIIHELIKWLGPFRKYSFLPKGKDMISKFISVNSKIYYQVHYNHQINLGNNSSITLYKFRGLKYINLVMDESIGKTITIIKRKNLDKWNKIL